MTLLAKIGERLYEFETEEDVTKARSLYILPECRTQNDLEDLMENHFIDYYIEDFDGLL